MALITIIAPIAALVTVLLVAWAIYALANGERLALGQRLGQYDPATGPIQVKQRNSPLFKDRSFSSIKALDKALSGRGYTDRVALELARAAVPLRVGEYLLIRWLVAAALFAVLMMGQVMLPMALLAALIGWYLPRIYVSRKEKTRVKKIEDQLVDTLTMMSNSLKSGASFLQAMELVARELPAPISQEFAQVVAEVGVGAPIDQALTDFKDRVRSYDVYLIVTAMTVQRNVGGNLSEVLQNIAGTIRERQRLLRQVQVETAEQRFSAYILLALPTGLLLAIATMNRGYLDPLLMPGKGQMMLIAALFLQLIGYLMMRRIADVKV